MPAPDPLDTLPGWFEWLKGTAGWGAAVVMFQWLRREMGRADKLQEKFDRAMDLALDEHEADKARRKADP